MQPRQVFRHAAFVLVLILVSVNQHTAAKCIKASKKSNNGFFDLGFSVFGDIKDKMKDFFGYDETTTTISRETTTPQTKAEVTASTAELELTPSADIAADVAVSSGSAHINLSNLQCEAALNQCTLTDVSKAEYNPTFGNGQVNGKGQDNSMAQIQKERQQHRLKFQTFKKHYEAMLFRMKVTMVRLFGAVLQDPMIAPFTDLCHILRKGHILDMVWPWRKDRDQSGDSTSVETDSVDTGTTQEPSATTTTVEAMTVASITKTEATTTTTKAPTTAITTEAPTTSEVPTTTAAAAKITTTTEASTTTTTSQPTTTTGQPTTTTTTPSTTTTEATTTTTTRPLKTTTTTTPQPTTTTTTTNEPTTTTQAPSTTTSTTIAQATATTTTTSAQPTKTAAQPTTTTEATTTTSTTQASTTTTTTPTNTTTEAPTTTTSTTTEATTTTSTTTHPPTNTASTTTTAPPSSASTATPTAGMAARCAVSEWSEFSAMVGFGQQTREMIVTQPGLICPESFYLNDVRTAVVNTAGSTNAIDTDGSVSGNVFEDVQLVTYNFQQDFMKPLCGKPRDILLILDSSGSIQPTDFEAMKGGVKMLIDSLCGGFGPAPHNHHLAIVQFSTNSQGVYTFAQDQSPDRLKEAVENLVPMNGFTCTGTGTTLELRHLMYDSKYGSRDFAEHDVLVITDGQSSCGPDLLQSSLLLQQRANVYALAIGLANKEGAAQEIRSLVSSQDPRHLFSLANFNDFRSMAQAVNAQSSPDKCQEIVVDNSN